jgi:hypothetical protein
MEIGDPRCPADGLVVAGRIVSAVSNADRISLDVREGVSVDIAKLRNRRVVFIPGGRN